MVWKHGFHEYRLAEQKMRSGSWNGNKKKKENEENVTDKSNLAYTWFLTETAKRIFEWEVMWSMPENVLFCRVRHLPHIRISYTWSFQVSSSYVLKQFFFLPCLWILQIRCFYLLSYSYLTLSKPNVCTVQSLIHCNLLLSIRWNVSNWVVLFVLRNKGEQRGLPEKQQLK